MSKTSNANVVTAVDRLTEVPSSLLRLLVVDDVRDRRDTTRQVSEAVGFETFVGNIDTAHRLLNSQNIDVLLIQLAPDDDGLRQLREFRASHPEVLIMVSTSDATVGWAVSAMKSGAFDLINEPAEPDELRNLLEAAAEEVKLAPEHRLLRETVNSQQSFGNIVGRSAAMERLYRIITKVAKSSHPVLIQGESGTGKELVARQIHFSGPHRDKPFIPVDCGSLVPTLIESELFGYVKGAFTGAVRAKEGLLQIANGGTVFLDEIGELPIDLQSKLLRAIQEKEVRPVGSTRTIPINVRILAATNRDLESAVREGTFRKDLFFRLNVVHLRIPPLRERRQDIPLLIDHFLERINRTSGVTRTLSEDARRRMLQYSWPGNIRELENCVERAGALSTGPIINVNDLPTQLQPYQRVNGGEAAHQPGVVSIAEMEKQAIYDALDRVEGDKLRAAKLLGIGKTTLYRKLKEYSSR